MSQFWPYSDIHEQLYYYVVTGDLDNVIKLLSEGASATKELSRQTTAICHAASRGKSEILLVLLQSCEEGESFFCNRMRANRSETEIDYTPDGMDNLEWDDEINSDAHTCSENDKISSLYRYYAKTFEQMGEILINTNYDQTREDPHTADKWGFMPIHYAAQWGHVECVRILLEYKSPVNCTTPDGETPLFLAKNEEIVRMLLSHGADPNRRTFNGRTALHSAITYGQHQIVQLLLQAGANINELNHLELTPLLTALDSNADDIALELIRNGANVNLKDRDGYTALYRAVMGNKVELAECLFGHGARPLISHYLLHACVKQNYCEMARLLLAHGEGLNVRDLSGCTPLFLAVFNCNIEMLQCLLENAKGSTAKINRTSDLICFAVQYADTAQRFAKIARILLAHGANLNGRRHPQTPLDRAIVLRKLSIAEFLIKEGAELSPNVAKSNFKSPNGSLLNIINLLVHAGFSIPRPNVENKLFNPMTLKCLCRIQVRKLLIGNLDKPIAHTNSYDESRLKVLCRQTGIPVILQRFVSDFDDLPTYMNKPIPPRRYQRQL